MKKDNQGITLVELIVVIAIMSVVTGALALSMSYIGKQKVSNAASSTKQVLQLAQTYTKSKGACKLKIAGSSDNGADMYIYTAANTQDLIEEARTFRYGNGPSNINKKITTIFYFDYDKSDETYGGTYTLDASMTVDIFFNRSTGGYDKSYVYKNGSKVYEGFPAKISFTNGDKTITLVLAKNTGVVTYDYN